MPSGSPGARMVLIVGFLAIVAGVPVGQVAVELRRGERAQFADLFRYAPRESNLRTLLHHDFYPHRY